MSKDPTRTQVFPFCEGFISIDLIFIVIIDFEISEKTLKNQNLSKMKKPLPQVVAPPGSA